MLWVRRFIFLLLLIIVTSGYYVVKRTTSYFERKEAEKYAHITAQIWIATARFHDNPEKYRQFRDSLLQSEKITKDDLNDYLHEYQDSPEKYLLFMTAVDVKMDSIIKLEDSLIEPLDNLPADSVLQID